MVLFAILSISNVLTSLFLYNYTNLDSHIYSVLFQINSMIFICFTRFLRLSWIFFSNLNTKPWWNLIIASSSRPVRCSNFSLYIENLGKPLHLISHFSIIVGCVVTPKLWTKYGQDFNRSDKKGWLCDWSNGSGCAVTLSLFWILLLAIVLKMIKRLNYYSNFYKVI